MNPEIENTRNTKRKESPQMTSLVALTPKYMKSDADRKESASAKKTKAIRKRNTEAAVTTILRLILSRGCRRAASIASYIFWTT
jgi:hypothetical protein